MVIFINMKVLWRSGTWLCSIRSCILEITPVVTTKKFDFKVLALGGQPEHVKQARRLYFHSASMSYDIASLRKASKISFAYSVDWP